MKSNVLVLFTVLSLLVPFLVGAQTLPLPDHIVIVVLENKSYDQIIGNTVDAPYINSIAGNGALFTQFYSQTHNSQPNYLMLFSGSDQGITDNIFPTNPPWNRTLPFHTPNMGACLMADGYSFKGYAQGLPWVGYVGESSGGYFSKHAVYSYWQGEGINTLPDSANQPFSNFPTDFNNLPTVSYVIPDAENNMHDGTILQGDTWVENNLSNYIEWANTNNSLFVLTFDEDDYSGSNHVATVITGQSVMQGEYNETLTHYNLLRTIEDIYGLCYTTANDSAAAPITSCWNASTTSTTEVESPFQNSRFYPNPFSSATSLQSELPLQNATLTVYNLYGQTVKQMGGISGHTATLFREGLPRGVYIVEVTQGDKLIRTDKLLVFD